MKYTDLRKFSEFWGKSTPHHSTQQFCHCRKSLDTPSGQTVPLWPDVSQLRWVLPVLGFLLNHKVCAPFCLTCSAQNNVLEIDPYFIFTSNPLLFITMLMNIWVAFISLAIINPAAKYFPSVLILWTYSSCNT